MERQKGFNRTFMVTVQRISTMAETEVFKNLEKTDC